MMRLLLLCSRWTRIAKIERGDFMYEEDIEQGYFEWLCQLAGVEREEGSYWLLFGELHRKKFFSPIERDGNREADGHELREQYMSEIGFTKYLDISEIEGCSVFEMMLGLAYRIAYEMDTLKEPYNDDEGRLKSVRYWFWVMIYNLKLDLYSDDKFVINNGMYSVDRILETLLRRTYNRNGSGGLFPLKRSTVDQRKVELWYQMCAYLNELEESA
jgi:hypothetical protein